MNICEIEEDELLDIKFSENPDKYFKYYHEIMNSNLSVLRVLISICKSNQLNIEIKPRVNNNFYCNCIFHHARDYSFRVLENMKAYCCYACGKGGTIVSLISSFYDISLNESIELLYKYISNDLSSLNEKQLRIINEAFKYYNSNLIDMLFLESQRKTELLDRRIRRYINEKDCQPGSEIRIANRLCCSKKYVKTIMPLKDEFDELPF